MLGADVLVAEALRLLRAISKDALTLVAERKVYGGGDLLANCGVRFYLLANRFNGCVGPQEPVGKRFILTEQAEQQVLSLYIRTAELAGFVPCKEDDAARFLGISFKHNCHRRDGLRLVQLRQAASPANPGHRDCPSSTLKFDHN